MCILSVRYVPCYNNHEVTTGCRVKEACIGAIGYKQFSGLGGETHGRTFSAESILCDCV
jgi:hypothetical protein